MNCCWFLFKWAAGLALVAALVAAPIYYRKVFFRVEEELRARVESKIAAEVPHLEVHLRSAHLTGEGIEARGLSFVERDAVGPQPELIFVDEIFLACRTNPQELLSGEPVVTSVVIRRPIVRATRRPDGSFSLKKLLPLPKPTGFAGPIAIENGMVEVFDPLKNPSSTFSLREINLAVKATLDTAGRPATFEVEGSLTGDHISRVEVNGRLDPEAGAWSLAGNVEGLEISPELRVSLPEPISDPMESLASLRAPADMRFHVSGSGVAELPKFEVDGSVARGRIDDPLLPFPLTDLAATFHCDNAGFQVHDLSTRHGQTIWQISQLDRRGYAADSPMFLQASGRQVRLDRVVADAIPEPWRQDWRNYDPQGEVNIDCTISYDGQKWKPVVHAECISDVSFTCHRFPYRLERAQGTLTLRENVMYVSLKAYSGSQGVTLDGQFFNPGPTFTGGIEIKGDKIPFDDKLFAALAVKPKARETIRGLNPHGTFDFKTRLWRDDPRVRELHQVAEVTLNRCSMNYEKFPYPLNNVVGKIYLEDGLWKFPKLVGSNGTGVVTCQGTLATSPNRDVLSLGLSAENVPLEEDLHKALRVSEQQLWNSLQPRGKVNFNANIGYDSTTKQMSIELWANPRDDATSIGTSIEPVAFPYRMEKLRGLIHYRDGHVDLEDLHAIHRNTEMSTSGSCDFKNDGSWHLQLKKLCVEKLRLQGEDHELAAALPESLRQAVNELRPTGPMKLRGDLDFDKSASGGLRTSWNVDLHLYQSSLQVGPELKNVFGHVRLKGSANGKRYSSSGELHLESLTYKNLQFTDILGPLYFDNENVYLGALPPNVRGPRAGHVTARLFDGTVGGDCHVKLGNVPQYQMIASIAGADLNQFARDNLTNHQKLKGKVSANINVRGSRGSHNLFADGDMHITDADVYELPLTVALLKIVRAKRPDSTAFTRCDIAFQINGEHVTLKQIELQGDAVSLSGDGEVTLDSVTNPVRLEFHTAVGRGSLPLLSGMFSQASQQIMKIHVAGTLDNPVTRTEPFPMAAQALERLRADYDAPRPAEIIRTLAPRR